MAEGEISLDLWSFFQLSGLPIDGEPYEEVSLEDAVKDALDGEGRYSFDYAYRYLMKAYRSICLVCSRGSSRGYQRREKSSRLKV